jgi:hypothetical protein
MVGVFPGSVWDNVYVPEVVTAFTAKMPVSVTDVWRFIAVIVTLEQSDL